MEKDKLLRTGSLCIPKLNRKDWELVRGSRELLLRPKHIVIQGHFLGSKGGKLSVDIYIEKSIHATDYLTDFNCTVVGTLFGDKSIDSSAFSRIMEEYQRKIDHNSWTLIGYSFSSSGERLPLMVFYSPFLDLKGDGYCIYSYKQKDESLDAFYGKFGVTPPSKN